MENNKLDKEGSQIPEENRENKKIESIPEVPSSSSEKITEGETNKKERKIYSRKKLEEILFNTDTDNLSKYLSSDYNSYLNKSIFENDILFNNYLLMDSTLDNQLKLADEINDLRKKLKKSAEDLKDTQADREEKILEFEKLKNILKAKEKTNHILTRISEEGRKKLLESEQFHSLFRNSNKCDAVVVSIDIRRSTELMLKARTPELFSKFITELSFKLSQIIISNFGIFDKFTGDGILAFFPKFYSGNEAIIRAIKASNECHVLFQEHYYNSKNCFNVFIKDIGLGIGIDFGNVTLVNTQNELTVVGIPVVYACRFSGAKAGETLVNQPAKEEIMNLCPKLVSFKEGEIIIKNEGTAMGYNVSLNEAAFDLEKPNWDELTEQYKTE